MIPHSMECTRCKANPEVQLLHLRLDARTCGTRTGGP
jgi:hypothetical protein